MSGATFTDMFCGAGGSSIGGETLAVVSHYAPGWTREAGSEPTGTITTTDGHSVVVPFQRGNDATAAAERPTSTLTARDKLALVIPYDSTGNARFADEQPAPTLTTRDRAAIVWTDDDIDGCRFRMFALHEISGAMRMDLGPAGGAYVVLGNKREQMAQYGNAVTPPATAVLLSRILPILDEASAA